MLGDEAPKPDTVRAGPTSAVGAKRSLLARLIHGATAGRIAVTADGLLADGGTLYAYASLRRPPHVSPGRFWSALELSTDRGLVRIEGYRTADLERVATALDAGLASTVRADIAAKMAPIDQVAAEIDQLLDGTRYIRLAHAEDLAQRAARLSMTFGAPLVERYVSPLQRQNFTRVDTFLRVWREQVADANAKYVTAMLQEHREFFDVVEASPLTEAQRRACVVNEAANLVLAGAGTGKTSTMVGRAGFLLKSGAALPNEILMLAFAKKAAQEMQERQVDRLALYTRAELTPTVKTFHALGLEIIGEAEGRRPAISVLAEDPLALASFIDEELHRQCMDPDYVSDLISWCFNKRFTYGNPFDFETETEYLEYVRTNELRTFNGELVKSYEELVVANFLAAHGIAYEYERKYQIPKQYWDEFDDGSERYQGFVQDAQHRAYMPDFYLPEHDIYIEHFALNGDMQPPEGWIGYWLGVKWKRELHAKHGTRLLETRSHMQYDGVLEMCLESMLRVEGIDLQPRPVEELLAELRDRGDLTFITRPISEFLGLLKQSDHDLHELRSRCSQMPGADRFDLFFQLFEPIFESYEKYLVEQDEIDFSDMIRRAIEHVEHGRFRSPYTHVLVDEFQDISALRARLIRALLAQVSDSTFFAVGDDWQAIYRFTGSDISFIRDFEGVFGPSVTTALDQTFRFNQQIGDIASRFVLGNPAQLSKSIRSRAVSDEPVVSMVPVSDPGAGLSLALAAIESRRLSSRRDRASVLVLGRYNFVIDEWAKGAARNRFKAQFPNLDVRFMTVHAAKGSEADYVVILNVERGRNGFPAEKPAEPLTEFVLPELEPFAFAEERRLFYVALTRARHRVYLVYEPSMVSTFVEELVALDAGSHRLVQLDEFRGQPGVEDNFDPIVCPDCGVGHLRRRKGEFGDFVSCTRFPYCRYTEPPCPECGGLMRRSDGLRQCVREGCGYAAPICPSCGAAMVKRTGPYGPFWGCLNYRPNAGTFCTHTINIGSPYRESRRHGYPGGRG